MVEESRMLDMAIKALDKQWGEHGEKAVLRGNEVAIWENRLSSGSISLDKAMGGGYPMGSVVEIFGPEASGKTTLALHAIAEAQQKGLVGLVVDTEQAIDPEYATALGVDMNEILISQPSTAQEALDIVDKLARTGNVGVIVLDSVAALATKEEIEADVGKEHVARTARLMSPFLRREIAIIHKTGTLVIFINQLREKIGIMFGSNEVTPGGRALKFYAHTRLDVRAVKKLLNGEDIVGNRTRVKVVKNKHAAPFKSAEFDLVFGKGIDTYGELLDLGVECGLVKQTGSWFKIKDESIAQGRHNAIEYLMNNKELSIEWKNRILNEGAEVAPTEEPTGDGGECVSEL